MTTKYFNFNNEEHILTIEVHENGTVELPVNGQVIRFSNVKELAEYYATARSVSPEHLKNWTLVEDGQNISFVLRAATAGIDFFGESPTQPLTWGEHYDEEMTDEDEEVELTDLEWKIAQKLGIETLSFEEIKDNVSVIVLHIKSYGVNDEVGYEIWNTIYDYKLGLLGSDGIVNQVEEANKALQVAALSRRDFFQVINVNIETEDVAVGQRLIHDPFRGTELVLKQAGYWVVYTR